MSNETKNILEELETSDYKYGFVSDIETETIGRGLSEDVVRLISEKKGEPEWMLESRLKAYRHWLTLEHPNWAHLDIRDHVRDSFRFIAEDVETEKAVDYFKGRDKQGRRLAMLVVTKHGDPKEKVTGVLTPYDVLE